MFGINTGKVIVGGLAAGIVVNLGQTLVHMWLLAEQSAAFSESLGVSGDPTTWQLAMYWVIGFILGFTMVKLYAVARPRLGPGVMTALVVGVFAFVLSELVPMLYLVNGGIHGFGEYVPFMIATFVILCVGSVSGACVYTEDEGGAEAAPAAPAAAPPSAPEPPSPPDSSGE